MAGDQTDGVNASTKPTFNPDHLVNLNGVARGRFYRRPRGQAEGQVVHFQFNVFVRVNMVNF
jgi:hypothetical protein